MLNEVRKEAFESRFVKTEKSSTSMNVAEDEDDDVDNSRVSTIFGGTVWSSWFPPEWIGWVMYGISSENPSEHWVTQTISDDLTEVEHFNSDDIQTKSSLKPPGSFNQTDKVTVESVNTKEISYADTLRAQSLLLMKEELEIIRSKRDLEVIMNLRRLAQTEEQVVSLSTTP